ncbi:MAG: glutathione S-transferase family protein [Rhizobiales bacterium]|nr:glutathione S-transferase family protein [Hyphomicrobiales bacterium]
MIRVWGRRSSSNVQKVLWTLGELDLPFKRETVGGSFGGNREADYLRMNPNGLIPVILDGDVTMFESNAIVRYLSARYRAGVLRPKEPKALAAAEQWMDWQQSTFYPAVGTIFWNAARVPAAQKDAAAVTEAEKQARSALLIADKHLSQHDWFAGERFSFGDIVMGVMFWRYAGVAAVMPDVPHLLEWFEVIKKRDAFREHVNLPVARSPEEWKRIEKELG